MVHAALHQALVVVDEQPARGEVGEVLVILHRHLVQSEVEGSCQSVCCAASEVSLVEDGEAAIHGAEVDELLLSSAQLLTYHVLNKLIQTVSLGRASNFGRLTFYMAHVHFCTAAGPEKWRSKVATGSGHYQGSPGAINSDGPKAL